MDGAGGRLHRLLQPRLVRVHGLDRAGDGGLGLAVCARSGDARPRRRALDRIDRHRERLRNGVPASPPRRDVSLVSDAGAAAPRRRRHDRPMGRHQHRCHGRPPIARNAGPRAHQPPRAFRAGARIHGPSARPESHLRGSEPRVHATDRRAPQDHWVARPRGAPED